MHDFDDVKQGDRIRITRTITNQPTSFITEETDLYVGLEGTITLVNTQTGQMFVNWDNGSKLCILSEWDDNKWEVIR